MLRCNYRTRIKDMLGMSIKERIEYNVCILIHKVINGDCLDYFSFLLKNEIEQVRRKERVQTRSEGNIHIKR